MMQQLYNFDKADFDDNGTDFNGKLFTELIADWEVEFNAQFKPFFANRLLANFSAMLLVKNCFEASELENFGIDGDFDLETNFKIDDQAKKAVVYGLGSSIKENEDEPLILVEDSSMADGVVLLKHVPDDGNEPIDDNPTVGERILVEKR